MLVARTFAQSRTALSALLALALAATSSSALAQSKDDLNKARVEFQEGLALAAANNCAAAITKFRSVARVKNTAQVSFNVAECEERMGRLAAALGDYRVAASTAANDKKAQDVYAKIGERVTALEGRVPKITVTRGKGADAAVIELDGVELGVAQLGTEIPVDPGPHVVVGKIGDKEYAHETVTLGEKESKTVDVVMKAPVTKIESADDTPRPAEKPAPPPEPPRSRIPGIVVASAGAVSVGVGFIFFALRAGTLSDLDALCGTGNTSCPADVKTTGQSIVDKGKLDTGIAEVTIGLGTVAIVTGIVLAATAGPKAPAASSSSGAAKVPWSVSFEPSAPGASVGGASLTGRF